MTLENLEFLIEQKLDQPTVVVNSQLYIVCYNQAAENCFQYKRDEVIGEHLNILIPGNFHHSHNRLAEQFIQKYEPPRLMNQRKTIIYGKRKDGREFAIKVAISNTHICGQRYAIACINHYRRIDIK
ncbi:PAS domain-containing protein [Zooshikella sp. RANM57]|uniref:PAS domain-containing protein n=1 Tax=Zooshikella sp. RANM57 TaxID=3425863 RepID=UPI003D6E33ED